MAGMRDLETLISSNGGGGRDVWAVVSWISCVPLRGRERIATQKSALFDFLWCLGRDRWVSTSVHWSQTQGQETTLFW